MTNPNETLKVDPSQIPLRTYNMLRDGIRLLALGILILIIEIFPIAIRSFYP